MNMNRASGILLHPTSLPGTAGIGTIGVHARAFVDWLVEANQTLWQILPISPTGYGDSPYQSFSTYAGNPLIIDLDMLHEEGWLDASQLIPPSGINVSTRIDFGRVVEWKIPLLKVAAEQFLERVPYKTRVKYEAFKNDNASWLDGYAIFMSIKEVYDAKAKKENIWGAMWSNYWPKDLATCDPKTISTWHENHVIECEVHKVIQFFFFTQWHDLKKYANSKGVSIIGDVPIFVAADSADVWANQHLFQLSSDGNLLAVAGVPPDYFSTTGQLWGNPLYNWEAMKKEGYNWWLNRIKALLKLVDYVRIDHFRGFEAYWSVPAGEKTAINGKWIPGPGHDLFRVIKKELGDIPIIAEDLGLITEEVKKLRDDFELPGMKILQFAFDINEAGKGGFTNIFLPHTYDKNCIVYTGSHDNATMQGWLNAASEEEIGLIGEYLGMETSETEEARKDGTMCAALIRLAFSSVAKFAVIPMQDLFALGDEARMNVPSTMGGINWQWRMGKNHAYAISFIIKTRLFLSMYSITSLSALNNVSASAFEGFSTAFRASDALYVSPAAAQISAALL